MEAFTKQIPVTGTVGGVGSDPLCRAATWQNPYVPGGNLKAVGSSRGCFLCKGSLLKEKLRGAKCCESAIFFLLIPDRGMIHRSPKLLLPLCSSFLRVLGRC